MPSASSRSDRSVRSTRYIVATCDYCPAAIVWANTGRAMMAVNPDPVPGGNVVLVPRAVGSPQAIVTTDRKYRPDLPRYVPHMADCPGAATVRRERKPPAPKQTETLF